VANGESLDKLLFRAATGDRPVVIDLLNHCRPGMIARLSTRTHVDEAEDIVQDALVLAIQRLDRFAWQGWDALQGWLWAFVENAYADRRKYHSRHCRDVRHVVGDVLPPGADTSHIGVLASLACREDTPSQKARRRERDSRLRRAMRDVLTDDQHLAIELRYFEHLPVEEVARHTGWTGSKVKMLCQRGLDRLREVLTESMRPSGAS
jgi:RNA polymerase sigma factor (sigma-70 family)